MVMKSWDMEITYMVNRGWWTGFMGVVSTWAWGRDREEADAYVREWMVEWMPNAGEYTTKVKGTKGANDWRRLLK